MNLLNYLVELYESSDDADVNSVFAEARQNHEFAELSKGQIVELKRQFLEYISTAEQLNSYEELNPATISEVKLQNIRFQDEQLADYAYSHPRNRNHRQYVEAFINNISVPKTLEELDNYYLEGNDAQVLVEHVESTGTTNWTVPRWAKRGDVVLFMHAKMANSSLTRLRTETNAEPEWAVDPELRKNRLHAIAEQLNFHKQYGGKIYAIGRINGKPEIEDIPPGMHFKSRVFCDIDNLFLLDEPVDLSEFNSFIKLSSMSAVTPVYGEPFDRLKSIITKKNNVPSYFRNSCSTPFPHNSVNEGNWMQLGLEYRNRFTLEIQFRQCYVDYLLKSIGDQKTLYMECPCYKGTSPITFVDNVIWFNKQLLLVEVKLNIKTEADLEGQCEQYCDLDRLILNKKTNREARMKQVISDKVLVIDTYAVYMFYLKSKKTEFLYDLDDLRSHWDIEELKTTISNALEGSRFS